MRLRRISGLLARGGITADTLFSAEMWQANNDNRNLQIRNQFPKVWEQLTELRDRGLHSCSKEYQDAEYQVPLWLFYFYDASAQGKLMESLEPGNLDVYCSIAGDDADVLIGRDIAKLDFRSQLKSNSQDLLGIHCIARTLVALDVLRQRPLALARSCGLSKILLGYLTPGLEN